jgi:peroxiredoxin
MVKYKNISIKYDYMIREVGQTFGQSLLLSDSLRIGSMIKPFSLKGIDNKFHTLEEFLSKKVLVIIFLSNTSRYSQAYDSRLISLQETFAGQSVQFIGINSNDDRYSIHDRLYRMSEWSRQQSYNFPYLKDPDQRVAKHFDAIATPEVFVFDKERILRYRGAIDDNWCNQNKVKRHYLRRAINNLLENKKLDIEETSAMGDPIVWHY